MKKYSTATEKSPDQPSFHDIIKQLTETNNQKVKIAITDIDGVLRGKLISFDKFKAIAEKGVGFCNVVFGWDANDASYDNAKITGWHSGYPDSQANIDPGTFRQSPWENDLPFFLADFENSGGPESMICPRSLLKRILQQESEAGYESFFSQEFEWFNFVRNSSELSPAATGNLTPLTHGMFGYSILRASQQSAYFNDLFDLLCKFRIPLEAIHTETGPGVYEAAIVYSRALEAADRAVLFKTGVKEIASRHGILATFMAKFSDRLPGCSGHVHQSIWSSGGSRNLFFDKAQSNNMSLLMESYMAGQLHCLPFILPMFAPTINSYKRLVEGAWAPTTITWGIDNRTTALRAILGGNSTRLETRVVGADSNPYLAMAGCLASGLYGIKNNLKLTTTATTGNGYADKKNGSLPKDLWEATQAMKQSGIAKELFGADFVEHFTNTREWEWRQFGKAVTDWEISRYLEII